MKRLITAIVCMVLPCLVPVSCATGAPETTSSMRGNSLRAGAWALQFDVNGPLLSVEPLSGGVSLKRQFSTKSALRVGIGVGASGRITNPSDDVDSQWETDSDVYRLSLESLYQRYFNPDGILNVYGAVGPVVSADRRTNDTDTGLYRSESTYTIWTAGGIAALGAEWFFARQFSLLAEYSARGYYLREEQEEIRFDADGEVANYSKDKITDWSVTLSGVRLGLSVYF